MMRYSYSIVPGGLKLVNIRERRFTKVWCVLAAEVGLIVVANAIAGLSGIEVFGRHQSPGFLCGVWTATYYSSPATCNRTGPSLAIGAKEKQNF